MTLWYAVQVKCPNKNLVHELSNTNYHRLYKIVIYIGHLLYNSNQQENDTVFLSDDTLTATCTWQAFTCPDYTSMDHCSWCPLTQVSEILSLSVFNTTFFSILHPVCLAYFCFFLWALRLLGVLINFLCERDILGGCGTCGEKKRISDLKISLTSKWKERVGS